MKEDRTEAKRGGDITRGRQEHTGETGRDQRQQLGRKRGDTEPAPCTCAHAQSTEKESLNDRKKEIHKDRETYTHTHTHTHTLTREER